MKTNEMLHELFSTKELIVINWFLEGVQEDRREYGLSDFMSSLGVNADEATWLMEALENNWVYYETISKIIKFVEGEVVSIEKAAVYLRDFESQFDVSAYENLSLEGLMVDVDMYWELCHDGA